MHTERFTNGEIHYLIGGRLVVMDIWTLLKILEIINKIISAISGFVAFLFAIFHGFGLTYLQSSILVGITFLIGFYIVFVLLKTITKIMIFVLTFAFIGIVLGAVFGII